jgi:MoxR-like ATPase
MFVTPITAKKMIQSVLSAGLVPFLQSSPGLGKSSIVREIAKEYDLQLIDIRLSQVDPTELNGFPAISNGVASYVPMSIFPLEKTPLPTNKKGWILFLDEMSSAPPAVQAAA